MSILIRPIITEKTTRLQEELRKFTFEVSREASKPDIKAALIERYPEIEIEKVNTVIMPSKPKGRFTRGGYIDGRSKVWKKAIVTLKEGSEIDLFSEV
jgi:large subunit ribosomal protein L23